MTRDPRTIAADIISLADSGLFDCDWYAFKYQAFLAAGSDPLVHFCNSGWLAGLNPNAAFDVGYYLSQQPDVKAAGVNPLRHYLDYGEAENRRPSADFDVAWYRQTHKVPAGANCLAHYLLHRPPPVSDAVLAPPEDVDPELAATVETIRQSGLFDVAYYRRTHNPEESELDPITHYCRSGWRQSLNPNPIFDTNWYFETYPEIQQAQTNPLLHYIRYGEYEGRRPARSFDPAFYRHIHSLPPYVSSLGHHLAKLDRSAAAADDPVATIIANSTAPEKLIEELELFDIDYYLANYPDIRESPLDPAAHFIQYGEREGRRPNAYFDPDWYKKTYLSPEEPLNPLLHYIKLGEAAGHRPIVYFDPTWYRSNYGLEAGMSPLRHFLRHRRSQRFSPLQLFDIAWYMERHGAQIGRNRDPFAHYLRVGISNDIDPGPAFDARQYRQNNMEPKASRVRPQPGAEIFERLRRETLHPLVHFLLQQGDTASVMARSA